MECRAYRYPNSPSLPNSRTTPSRVFENIGVDLAGPFLVRDQDNHQKRWVCLFTCMSTRAIHLEVLTSVSGECFINCLRRFAARRGRPREIISDNATNFKLGQQLISQNESETLQNIFDTNSLENFLANEKTLSCEEFYTLIIETEGMVNSRPLAYAGSSLEDSMILRPIDFLIPNAQPSALLPLAGDMEEMGSDPSYIPTITTKQAAINRLNDTIKHLSRLWKAWTEQYLLELRNLHQIRIKQNQFTRTRPRVGEVVLIMEANTDRGHWPMGLVTELKEDPDGEVREVALRTANRETVN
ncbi:hypothetical protein OSTOST_05481 [Ostertagia ostertagi]